MNEEELRQYEEQLEKEKDKSMIKNITPKKYPKNLQKCAMTNVARRVEKNDEGKRRGPK
jgi:succinate dehydrogenase flavin-adding protein (antitoxin of CptAB toxin-antitoxin module)